MACALLAGVFVFTLDVLLALIVCSGRMWLQGGCMKTLINASCSGGIRTQAPSTCLCFSYFGPWWTVIIHANGAEMQRVGTVHTAHMFVGVHTAVSRECLPPSHATRNQPRPLQKFELYRMEDLTKSIFGTAMTA